MRKSRLSKDKQLDYYKSECKHLREENGNLYMANQRLKFVAELIECIKELPPQTLGYHGPHVLRVMLAAANGKLDGQMFFNYV